MLYRTNQIDDTKLFSNENYKKIAEDFWLYKFSTMNPSYQYSLIDELKQNLSGVKSVVYLQGKTFYALFDKTAFTNQYDLEESFDKLISDNKREVIYKKIDNLKNLQVDCKSEFQELQSKRYLAQLLFNSLANISNENVESSNTTGNLYWIISAVAKKNGDFIEKYVTLNIKLDFNLNLQLRVETFTNILLRKGMAISQARFEKLPRYEIKSDAIRTMKRVKYSKNEKDKSDIFVQSKAGDKSIKKFLNFSDWINFQDSKSGVLYKFLDAANSYLSDYLTIEFVKLPFSEDKTTLTKKKSELIKKRVLELYQTKPIVINIAESLKKDKKAIKLADDLKQILSDSNHPYKIENVSIGKLSKDAFNIRIIHNESHYKKHKIEDEYLTGHNLLLQHITIKEFKISKKGKNDNIYVVLKEGYIKNDIREGKITLEEWKYGE